ncbi:hypothetical protein OH76DRAFT_94994 [Lentinus brumalis]|uniref:Uncharacterized protein n=1 Tax=Lentinus brumalis TaxID=2498619 RepID=A0A371CQP8_9APHY|nr:hypothetical protein OH76DRAFT_94994 [Polyporus brumalis]
MPVWMEFENRAVAERSQNDRLSSRFSVTTHIHAAYPSYCILLAHLRLTRRLRRSAPDKRPKCSPNLVHFRTPCSCSISTDATGHWPLTVPRLASLANAAASAIDETSHGRDATRTTTARARLGGPFETAIQCDGSNRASCRIGSRLTGRRPKIPRRERRSGCATADRQKFLLQDLKLKSRTGDTDAVVSIRPPHPE